MKMPKRTAKAKWTDTLKNGQGTMALGSGAWEGPFSFGTRFEDEQGTNPEELIGAAAAGCFSMALSVGLEKAHATPKQIDTHAQVYLEKSEDGFSISKIQLETEVQATGIEEDAFQKVAEETKKNCPVSKALKGPEILLKATLK